MTFHAANGRLMCHYCGHSEPLPVRCPKCGGHLKPMGAGTQKAVAELERIFPGTEILRMDADTVSASHGHEALLARFEKERIPILVGTQMVAKGLNFENVTLAGVLDADMSLYMEDFRAAETTLPCSPRWWDEPDGGGRRDRAGPDHVARQRGPPSGGGAGL